MLGARREPVLECLVGIGCMCCALRSGSMRVSGCMVVSGQASCDCAGVHRDRRLALEPLTGARAERMSLGACDAAAVEQERQQCRYAGSRKAIALALKERSGCRKRQHICAMRRAGAGAGDKMYRYTPSVEDRVAVQDPPREECDDSRR